MSARPVFLHIGLQKTGTSYLQAIFWAAQDQLRTQGLDLVPGTKRDTFHLMLDVRGRYDRELDPPDVATAVDWLPAQLAAASGAAALVSEESLASCTVAQGRRLVDACADREVHVIVTVRDLARVLPSMWQQQLRSGGAVGWDDYLDNVVRRQGPAAKRFWNNQGLVKVLQRWSAVVPAERIHLVTVPPSGAPPTLLLERYCEVLGVDPAPLAEHTPRGNPSLGRVEAELLRRVNAALPAERRRRQVYGTVGKRYFSQDVLGELRSDRTRVPQRLETWCGEQAERVVATVAAGEYDVHGDLDDLRPRPDSFGPDGGQVSDSEVAEVAVAAITTMLERRMARLARRQRRRGRAGARGGRRPGRAMLRAVRHRAARALRRRTL
jgi:hypothetical protein